MIASLPEPNAAEMLATAPRHGRILVEGGRLQRVERLWLPPRTSLTRVWWDNRFGRSGAADTCVLTYRGTRSIPGFLAIDYLRSGPHTSLRTVREALAALDGIAHLRQSVAIVAHVSTTAISDRLLRREGWEPQNLPSGGRHWIKRFYDTNC